MVHRRKGATVAEPTISDFYLEERTFPPSAEFLARALVTDRSLYEEAERDCVAFLQSAGYRMKIISQGWWRAILPENRPSLHNRWLVAWKEPTGASQ